jgi:3-oxoacyl-[acyl-carrier-protein] synthase-1
MSAAPLVIANVGLVTSVGLSFPATCAAIRASIANHSPTRVYATDGQWIVGAQVELKESLKGRARFVRMLAMAIDECLAARPERGDLPLLVCLPTPGRNDEVDTSDASLLSDLGRELSIAWEPSLSSVFRCGRGGVFAALARARMLMTDRHVSAVVVAAADSLLGTGTLSDLDRRRRLLTDYNSDGFVAGEAAGALLVTRTRSDGVNLVCRGLGVAREEALPDSGRPLRADGLTTSIMGALQEAGCAMQDIDWRVTDNSGEQYYFKEAAIALARLLRVRKEEFDIWHPAECVGEVGAAIGPIMIGAVLAAGQRGYAPGAMALLHAGDDSGDRYAAVLQLIG